MTAYPTTAKTTAAAKNPRLVARLGRFALACDSGTSMVIVGMR
jgi:hypothetical protein